MPLIGYKDRFAEKVQRLEKLQTIRAVRKRPFAPGDRLYHYTGLRTKKCRKLGESTAAFVYDITVSRGTVTIDGQALYRRSAEAFAVADGFDSLDDFLAFFDGQFSGQLVTWDASSWVSSS